MLLVWQVSIASGCFVEVSALAQNYVYVKKNRPSKLCYACILFQHLLNCRVPVLLFHVESLESGLYEERVPWRHP